MRTLVARVFFAFAPAPRRQPTSTDDENRRGKTMAPTNTPTLYVSTTTHNGVELYYTFTWTFLTPIYHYPSYQYGRDDSAVWIAIG